jgi:Protein of unknown function (DUF4238)
MIRKNHYVPEIYLKQFASKATGRLFSYRTLVSHDAVKLWKPGSPAAMGYYVDLYTRLILGNETDEIDTWFCSEFEDPASPVLERVANDEDLRPDDWTVLVRLLASLIVRTPAFFVKMLPLWNRVIPAVMERTFAEVKAKLEWSRATGQPLAPSDPPEPGFPIKTHRLDVPEEGVAKLTTTVVVGRDLWLYEIRRMLTETIKVLYEHHWCIFHASFDDTFFTSDDPVVRLNYFNREQYDFEGGWGKQGTEILLPLTPKHLLYTKIGAVFPSRGLILNRSETRDFRKMIAEHAYRFIYASEIDGGAQMLRPREVNEPKFNAENREWRNWHRDQLEAQREFQ